MTHWYDLPAKHNPAQTGYEQNVSKIDASAELNPTDKINARAELKRKYDARYLVGDIIDVRQDTLGMCGLEPDSFLLIKVPGMTFDEAFEYSQRSNYIGGTGKEKIKNRRKYNIDISGLTFSSKTITLTVDEFKKRISNKG